MLFNNKIDKEKKADEESDDKKNHTSRLPGRLAEPVKSVQIQKP